MILWPSKKEVRGYIEQLRESQEEKEHMENYYIDLLDKLRGEFDKLTKVTDELKRKNGVLAQNVNMLEKEKKVLEH